MAEYENEFSQFPIKKITKHNFKNINKTVAPIINEINTLMLRGSHEQAAALIQENSTALASYVIDAVTFRTLEEEIYNTQVYAKQVQQSVRVEEEEPDDCKVGDLWIGGA